MKSQFLFRDQRNGFSLIELLVSIAIISILLALLLPVLPAARRAGQLAKCMSNMRQISTAVLMYNTDNEGYFPGTMEEVSSAAPVIISYWPIKNYQAVLASYINMEKGGINPAGTQLKAGVWYAPADPEAAVPIMWGSFVNNGFITGVV